MKVLVAANSSVLRSRFTKLLASASGVKSLSAVSNYQELLQSWRSENPDVIVTEVFLDGGSALQAMSKQTSAGRASQVVVLMDERNAILAARCLDAGANAVFLKSTQWNELVKKVSELAQNALVNNENCRSRGI